MYTSLKLSKLLADNGFDKEKEAKVFISENGDYITDEEYWNFQDYAGSIGIPAGSSIEKHYPAYDILNDLCVKYADDIFPKDFEGRFNIMVLLQQNKQDEAEEYIWEHCKFNPKNK